MTFFLHFGCPLGEKIQDAWYKMKKNENEYKIRNNIMKNRKFKKHEKTKIKKNFFFYH